MRYTLLHNITAECSRPWVAGDRLADGWTGELDAGEGMGATLDALEVIFQRHNYGNRPDGHTAPSLSVGDIVVLGEAAFAVQRLGYIEVPIDQADLLHKPYRDVVLW